MTDRTEMTERHARILKRLSQFGDALVEQVHADVAAAETPEARQAAVKSFHVISRSLRQTLALEARFEREQRRVEIQAQADAERVAARDAQARQAARKTDVRRTVEHLIWNEWELPDDQAERVLREAGQKLDGMDFDLDQPVEDQILLLSRRLGFAPVDDDDDEYEDEDDDPPASRPAPPGRGRSG